MLSSSPLMMRVTCASSFGGCLVASLEKVSSGQFWFSSLKVSWLSDAIMTVLDISLATLIWLGSSDGLHQRISFWKDRGWLNWPTADGLTLSLTTGSRSFFWFPGFFCCYLPWSLIYSLVSVFLRVEDCISSLVGILGQRMSFLRIHFFFRDLMHLNTY